MPDSSFETFLTSLGLNNLCQKECHILVKNWILGDPFHKKWPVLIILVPAMIRPSGSELFLRKLTFRGCWGCVRSKRFQMMDQAYISTPKEATGHPFLADLSKHLVKPGLYFMSKPDGTPCRDTQWYVFRIFKKALIGCPWYVNIAMILCRLRMPFCSLAKLLGLHPRSSQSLTPVIAHSLPHAWKLPVVARGCRRPRVVPPRRRRIM